MSTIKIVEYTGTGAALGIDLGFVPTMIKIYDSAGGLAGTWDENMADAECQLYSPYIDSVISDSAPGIGTTNTALANKAFQYQIAGIPYNKAAVAAGTAITATTVPVNKYGAFGKSLASDGTLDTWDAANNATGYNTEALAIAAIRAVSAAGSHVRAFFVVVVSNSGAFVGQTTALNASNVTATYYSFSDRKIYSGGITPIDETEYVTSGTIYRPILGTSATPSTTSPLQMRGISIGTSAYINTSGASYILEAIME